MRHAGNLLRFVAPAHAHPKPHRHAGHVRHLNSGDSWALRQSSQVIHARREITGDERGLKRRMLLRDFIHYASRQWAKEKEREVIPALRSNLKERLLAVTPALHLAILVEFNDPRFGAITEIPRDKRFTHVQVVNPRLAIAAHTHVVGWTIKPNHLFLGHADLGIFLFALGSGLGLGTFI